MVTVRFRAGVRRETVGGAIVLHCSADPLVVSGVLPSVAGVLDALASPEGWREHDAAPMTFESAAQWEWLRRELQVRAALQYHPGGAPVALIPRSPAHVTPCSRPEPGTRLTMRRDAFATWSAEGMLLQSPTTPMMVLLTDHNTGVLHDLARGLVVSAPSTRGVESSSIIDALWHAGLAVTASPAHDGAAGLSLADKLLHAQSRGLRTDIRRGKRAAAARERTPPAQVTEAPVIDTGTHPLAATPQLERLRALFARRRSERTYAAHPPTLGDIGTLLSTVMQPVANGGLGSRHRAYPSGGGLHALDAYVAVSACDGLAPGLYAYDSTTTALRLVAGQEVARALVRTARHAAGQQDDGQLLLIAAMDLACIADHYDGIPYTLALREIGAWMQVVQMAGSALGLATCPVGSGDSALFARALQTDPFSYTSLGEVLIGRPLPETAA